jgi:hypothetical protein
LERRLSGAELQDWWERCGIHYSAIVGPTGMALLQIFESNGEVDASRQLENGNAEYEKRLKAYAAHANATRESMLRAVLAARVIDEHPSEIGTP